MTAKLRQDSPDGHKQGRNSHYSSRRPTLVPNLLVILLFTAGHRCPAEELWLRARAQGCVASGVASGWTQLGRVTSLGTTYSLPREDESTQEERPSFVVTVLRGGNCSGLDQFLWPRV